MRRLTGISQATLIRRLTVTSVPVALLLALGVPARPVAADPTGSRRPPRFVDATRVVPHLVVEARYFGAHNFVGRRVDGYEAPRCLLTAPAAAALKQVQEELLPMGLSLKVYDCYRPARAVRHFVRWARDLRDTKTKAEFYPTMAKRDAFKLGYIAERSGHSRGSTVDLTIVPRPTPAQPRYRPGQPLRPCFAARRWPDNSLDMGTGYDCFHELAATAHPKVSPQARANRALLKALMERHGFVNYPKEWWHYTLRNEPYPKTYFDVPVK